MKFKTAFIVLFVLNSCNFKHKAKEEKGAAPVTSDKPISPSSPPTLPQGMPKLPNLTNTLPVSGPKLTSSTPTSQIIFTEEEIKENADIRVESKTPVEQESVDSTSDVTTPPSPQPSEKTPAKVDPNSNLICSGKSTYRVEIDLEKQLANVFNGEDFVLQTECRSDEEEGIICLNPHLMDAGYSVVSKTNPISSISLAEISISGSKELDEMDCRLGKITEIKIEEDEGSLISSISENTQEKEISCSNTGIMDAGYVLEMTNLSEKFEGSLAITTVGMDSKNLGSELVKLEVSSDCLVTITQVEDQDNNELKILIPIQAASSSSPIKASWQVKFQEKDLSSLFQDLECKINEKTLQTLQNRCESK